MDAIWTFPYERFLELPVALAVPGEDGDVFQAEIVDYGRRVLRFRDADEAKSFLADSPEDVLGWLVDASLIKALSANLTDVLDSVPVLAVGTEPSLAERMAMVKIGVEGCLSFSSGAVAALDLLVERFAARSGGAIRLLGVTDDKTNQNMAFLADAGRDGGFSCRLATPKAVWTEIATFRPELVIVDGRMSKVDVEGLANAVAQIGSSPRFCLISKPLGVESMTDENYIPAKTITIVSPDAEKIVQTVKSVTPLFRSRGVLARTMRRLSGVGLYGVEAYLEGQLGLLSDVVIKAARQSGWVVVCHLAGSASPAESRMLSERVGGELLNSGGVVQKIFLVSNDQFIVFVGHIAEEKMVDALRTAVGPIKFSGSDRTRFYAGAAAFRDGNVQAGMASARKAMIRAEIHAATTVEIAVV